MRPPFAVDATGLLRAEVGTILSDQACRSLAPDSPGTRFLIADGKVVYANRSGEEALGIRRHEASSRGLGVFRMVAVAPEYLDLSLEGLPRRSRGEDVPPPADYALLTRDGRRIEGVLTGELIEHEGRWGLIGLFTASTVAGAVELRAPHRRSGTRQPAGGTTG